MLIHVFHSGAIPGSTGYFGYTLKRVPKTSLRCRRGRGGSSAVQSR